MTLVPVGLLLINSFNTSPPGQPADYGFENWTRAFHDPTLQSAAWNTIKLGVPRVLIALVIASVLSWLIARTDMPGARLAEVLLWLAFFVPPLTMTLGEILLYDEYSGAVNQLIRNLFGLDMSEGPLSIHSYWGIIYTHLSVSTVPFMTILLIPSFRRMGAAFEEAARTCGASQFMTVIRVTLPLMAPALMAAGLLSFIYSLKAFEIELLLGTPVNIQVYSTQIYEWVRASPPEFGIATALGIFFIPIMIALAILQRIYVSRRSFVTIGSHTYSDDPARLGRVGRWVAATLVAGYIVITILLPLGAVVFGSFMRRFGYLSIAHPFTTEHWSSLLADSLFTSALGNSIVLGLAATIVGVVVYFSVAYVVTRSQLFARGAIDLMAWIPLAIPGILLGLGLLWFYLGTPVLRTALYGTLLGVAIALVIDHLSTGTQQMKTALLQVSSDNEQAARICGAGPLRTYWRILFPLLGPSIAATAILTFGSAVRDTSTVVLLASVDTQPMSILLLQYSTTGALEQASAIGVVMSAIVVVMALISRRLGGGRMRRGSDAVD